MKRIVWKCIYIVHNYFSPVHNTINIDKESIHNLTQNYCLTNNQQLTLALGLNFVPIPQPQRDYKHYLLTQFDEYSRRVRLRAYFTVHPTNSDNNTNNKIDLKIDPKHSDKPLWQPPILFMNIENYLEKARNKIVNALHNNNKFKYKQNPKWLSNSITQLTQMTKSDLIVKPADKNMGVTIQNRLTYELDCLNQLLDINTYKSIEFNSVDYNQLFDTMIQILTKYNKMYNYNDTSKPTKLAQYILQMNNTKCKHLLKLAGFYIIYKVHKTPVVGRPICSNINTVTYYASKFIDKRLQPFMKLATSYVKSAQSIVMQLERFQVHNSYKHSMVIVCADVTSLYPSIPIKLGVKFMHDRLTYINNNNFKKYNKYLFTKSTDNKSSPDIDFICELSLFILENNFIEFGDKHFQQTCGTAMGTPLAVAFANLFLQQLEFLVFQQLSVTGFPVLFKRYIDDILAFFKNKQHALEFINIYNSIVDTINITNTISQTEGVFLDLVVYVGPRYTKHNKLDVKLYQKPQNKYLYLPQFSYHNIPIFKAFINAEINRILFNCSQNCDFLMYKELFKQRLLKRTYCMSFLNKMFAVPRSRADLIQRILNKQYKLLHINDDNKYSKNQPIIFKSTFDQESHQFALKSCLKLPLNIVNDPLAFSIFSKRNPIICYGKSQNLAQKLSRTKYNHKITTLPQTEQLTKSKIT
jgi:hypothetical protein